MSEIRYTKGRRFTGYTAYNHTTKIGRIEYDLRGRWMAILGDRVVSSHTNVNAAKRALVAAYERNRK